MRLIDLDDDRHVYCGDSGEYERWNICTEVPVIEAQHNDVEDVAKLYYIKGLTDAWECSRKLVYSSLQGGLTPYILDKIFGTTLLSNIFKENSALEAINKIEEWSKNNKEIINETEIKISDIIDMIRGE